MTAAQKPERSAAPGPAHAPAPGLAPFVPALLLWRLHARGPLPAAPAEQSVNAAAIFVDLSGFTSLAERLAARGPAGAEELSRALDEYFARLAAAVEDYGGDLVFYAGDGALAVWPTERDRGLHDAAWIASRCALDVVAALDEAHAGTHSTLRPRAAVAAGAVSLYEVGGAGGRWLSFLGGPALADLAGAIAVAHAGEVLVTSATRELVSARCRTAPRPADDRCALLLAVERPRAAAARAPDPPHVPDDALLPYVPEVVASRLLSGHGEWLAEFRTLTVLFVGLGDLAAAPGSLDRVQRAAEEFQHAVRECDGTVHQAVVDDKGAVLVAIFGLPPLAHDDDAVRATLAALSLSSRLAARGERASIGVATGRAFCGVCGGPRRRQYGVVGPVMNLAARLMQAAAGRVLCDAATSARARVRLHFEELAPVALKGAPEATAVFAPGERRAQAAAGVRLVGRPREQGRLRAAVDRAARGRGGLVTITGPPGIGKSWLLATVAEMVAARGGSLLRSAGDVLERSTPYHAWRQPLRDLLGNGDSEACETDLGERLQALLAGDADVLRWAALLRDVLPLDLAEDDFMRAMPSEARARAIHRVVVRLLERRAARRPVVVAIDDAHWLDAPSAALVRTAIDSIPSLLVVLASRDVDAPSRPDGGPGVAAVAAESIVLGPLSADAVREAIARALGVEAVDEGVVAFVSERAGGSPLFTDELTRAVRDAGLVDTDGGRATARGDLRSVELPESVHAAVRTRVDRLSPLEVLVLKAASVVGPSFTAAAVDAAYPVDDDRHRVRAALDALERAELVEHDSAGTDDGHRFRHAVVHEAVYALLPYAQRRAIHRRVAAFYESAPEGARPWTHSVLAHHHERAGDAGRAVHHLERAAEQALRAFAGRDAAAFLQRAEHLAAAQGRPEPRARVAARELLHGEASYQLGDYAAARRHYTRSLSARGLAVPLSRAGLAVDLAAQLARQLAHRAWPARFVGSAAGPRREALGHAAVVYNRFSSLAWYRGDQLALVHSIFAVLNCAERAGVTSDAVHGHAAMAVLFGMAGMHGAARAYADRALRLAETAGNPADAARAHIDTAIYAIGSGLWEQTALHVEQALDLYRRLGDRQTWEASRALDGYLHLARGDLPGALARFDEVYASAADGGLVQSRVWAQSGRVAVALARGRADPAAVDDLRDMALSFPDNAESIAAHGLVALARLRDGRTDDAIDAARLCLRRLRERRPGAVYYAFWGLGALAEAWLEVWAGGGATGLNADPVRDGAAEACRVLRAFARNVTIARPRAALCTARYAALSGRPREAARRRRAGLAAAASLRMPLEEELLRADLDQ